MNCCGIILLQSMLVALIGVGLVGAVGVAGVVVLLGVLVVVVVVFGVFIFEALVSIRPVLPPVGVILAVIRMVTHVPN